MQEVTVYTTAMQAVRITADNCRRLLSLLDAFGVAVNILNVDSPEMRSFVQELLAKQPSIGWRKDISVPKFELPLCFVGPVLVGTYDTVAELNEEGELATTLRISGYSGNFRAAAHNAIPIRSGATFDTNTISQEEEEEEEDKVKGDSIGRNKDESKSNESFSDDMNDNSINFDNSDEEEPPPPPPEEDDEEEKEEKDYDSALNSESLDDDDDDEPPPPPPDEDDEEVPPPPDED